MSSLSRLLRRSLLNNFSVLNVEGRLNTVVAAVQQHCGASALLIAAPENIRYLTGFTGSSATVLARHDHSVLITDGRYVQQAKEQTDRAQASVEIIEARNSSEVLRIIVGLLHASDICAFDAGEFSYERYDELVHATFCTMLSVSGVVAELRRVKTEPEIERIRFAAQTADAALQDIVPLLETALHQQITERDVRDELEYRLRKHGADGPSYETIVATGANAALPHHRPTHCVLQNGDAVVIDVGGLVDGYHSDMTRTFLLGDVDATLTNMFAVVSHAQRAGIEAVRAGVCAHEIDAVCRMAIAGAGYGPEFVHGTGHGVGLMIHESPWLRATSMEPLRTNEVVTVEPGVYRVGLGGVRIEDLLLVTHTGSTSFTQFPKDQLCLQFQPTI